MKERPILFSAPMVRALLDGSKTQTRRALRQQPALPTDTWEFAPSGGWIGTGPSPATGGTRQTLCWTKCPYGQPGDRLWVRESHVQVLEVDIPAGRAVGPVGTMGSPARPDWKSRYVYRADGEMPNVQWHHLGDSQPVRWTSSIHMPRVASRILLEVVSVRVERLNECSQSDAIAEGALSIRSKAWDREHFPAWRYLFDEAVATGEKPPVGPSPVQAYQALWESINGVGSWDANPWVWVVEFKQVVP